MVGMRVACLVGRTAGVLADVMAVKMAVRMVGSMAEKKGDAMAALTESREAGKMVVTWAITAAGVMD